VLEYTKSPPLQAPHYHKLTFAIPVPVTIRCFYPGKKSLPEDRCGLRTASDPSVSTTAANSTSLILEAPSSSWLCPLSHLFQATNQADCYHGGRNLKLEKPDRPREFLPPISRERAVGYYSTPQQNKESTMTLGQQKKLNR